MKQVLLNGKGHIEVGEVPLPVIVENQILVRVQYSVISSGTELSEVGRGILNKVKERPELLQKVRNKLSKEGLAETITTIKDKFSEHKSVGYSAMGVVYEVGQKITDLSLGDRVACAGAGVANHAEYIAVPRNLAVKVPSGLDSKEAAFVTLGSIALQGVRRLDPTLGEHMVVVGLGILGQLTVQLLTANGCHVFGVDLLDNRLQLAEQIGAEKCFKADDDLVRNVLFYTENVGADGVIITAGTKSNQPVNQGFAYTREKGRVVVVGSVGMELDRTQFYLKEQDLLISRSYGPGRYDENYEIKGRDYPLPYVRWTENRNMAEFLRLVTDKKVNVLELITGEYPIEEACTAYNNLQEKSAENLAVLLSYSMDGKGEKDQKKKTYTVYQVTVDKIGIALIGGGAFASKVHLPNLAKLKRFHVAAIVCRTPHKATDLAKRYKADYASTDYREVLADPNIDAVLIATRHNLHYPISIAAAKAGKHIYLEKPMALTYAHCEEIVHKVQEHNVAFMVGYNRRYSSLIKKLKELLQRTSGCKVISYRVNAGFIPRDHWVNDQVEGGGRIIGECCHFLDLMNFVLEEDISDISVVRMGSENQGVINGDNFSAGIQFSKGSIANLVYTSVGSTSFPKERLEVFADQQVFVIDDFKELLINGRSTNKERNKGYLEALKRFEVILKEPSKEEIDNYLSIMKWTFELNRKVNES